ncbi:MAG: alpha/beta hydrolase [Vicinamibacteraceae bacterium]
MSAHPAGVRQFDGPAGRLEARIDEPADAPRAVAVIAPPHPELGGTLHDRVVYHATQGLTRVGCAVVRFTFRGAGSSDGTFTGGPGERDDFRTAIDVAAARYPGLPVWAVGYSFGSWIALDVGAGDPRVTHLVAIAPPIDGYDFAAVATAGKPVFMIHGEFDHFTSTKAMQRFYGTLAEPRELVIVDGADHLFDGHVSEIADTIADLLHD